MGIGPGNIGFVNKPTIPSNIFLAKLERCDILDAYKKSQPISFLGLTSWDDFEHE